MKKHIFLLAGALLLGCQSLMAQGVALNTTGATADNSAMLDVASTTQGMLAPRMDSAQRSVISTPATGLMVYQTDGVTPGFYYYSGSAWTAVSASVSSLPNFTLITGTTTLSNTPACYLVASGIDTISLPASPTAGMQLYIFTNANNVYINTNGISVIDLNGTETAHYLGTIVSGIYRASESTVGAGNSYFGDASLFIYDGTHWNYASWARHSVLVF